MNKKLHSNNPYVNIEVVSDQRELSHETIEVSDSERMALLAKYFPEEFEKAKAKEEEIKKQPVPLKKRNNITQGSRNEYIDYNYKDVEGYSMKIEIRSDMEIPK